MPDFFLRDGDDQRAQGAQHLDDIDLVESTHTRTPWGPALVAVAQRAGEHVCWYCGEAFDGDRRALQPAEIQLGYSRVLLHRGCVDKKPRSARSFEDVQRGLSARRFFAKATQGLAKVADSASKVLHGLSDE